METGNTTGFIVSGDISTVLTIYYRTILAIAGNSTRSTVCILGDSIPTVITTIGFCRGNCTRVLTIVKLSIIGIARNTTCTRSSLNAPFNNKTIDSLNLCRSKPTNQTANFYSGSRNCPLIGAIIYRKHICHIGIHIAKQAGNNTSATDGCLILDIGNNYPLGSSHYLTGDSAYSICTGNYTGNHKVFNGSTFFNNAEKANIIFSAAVTTVDVDLDGLVATIKRAFEADILIGNSIVISNREGITVNVGQELDTLSFHVIACIYMICECKHFTKIINLPWIGRGTISFKFLQIRSSIAKVHHFINLDFVGGCCDLGVNLKSSGD